jgi:hypothetical protein
MATPNAALRYAPEYEHAEKDEAKTTAELIETLRHIAGVGGL